MNADDAGRPGRDHALNRFRIQVVRIRIYVCKDRGDALPVQRVCSGDEGVGGDDDLAG